MLNAQEDVQGKENTNLTLLLQQYDAYQLSFSKLYDQILKALNENIERYEQHFGEEILKQEMVKLWKASSEGYDVSGRVRYMLTQINRLIQTLSSLQTMIEKRHTAGLELIKQIEQSEFPKKGQYLDVMQARLQDWKKLYNTCQLWSQHYRGIQSLVSELLAYQETETYGMTLAKDLLNSINRGPIQDYTPYAEKLRLVAGMFNEQENIPPQRLHTVATNILTEAYLAYHESRNIIKLTR